MKKVQIVEDLNIKNSRNDNDAQSIKQQYIEDDPDLNGAVKKTNRTVEDAVKLCLHRVAWAAYFDLTC